MQSTNTLTVMILALLATAGSPVHAQSEQGVETAPLEEVVVSARRREENLQDVPLAIDTFDQLKIDELNLTNTQDVARYTPALTFDVGALPNDTRPSIRGVNTNRGRPNVAMLVDFVDVSSEAMTVAGGGITANLRLLDLERIEVVKGPQSVLYGRSAFTGAVNYITRRPEKEFEGKIEAGYDEHNTYDLGLSISGPLAGDSLTGRLTLASHNTDGWYKNPNTGGDLGDGDSQGISVALEYEPSDEFNIYFRAETSEENYGPRAEVFKRSLSQFFDPALNFLGTGSVTDHAVQLPYAFNGTVCNGIDRQQPYFDSFGMGPACRPIVTGEQSGNESEIDLSPDPRTGRDFTGTKIDNTRFHLDVAWTPDAFSAHYLMGYTDNSLDTQQDFDLTNYRILAFPPFASQFGMSAMAQQSVDTEQWSHEIRFSGDGDRFHWVASALYWTEDQDVAFDDEWWLREGADRQLTLDLFNNFVFTFLPPPGLTYIATGPGNTPATPMTRDTDHWSVAASFGFDFTDTLTLTAEGRYLDETIKYTGSSEDVSFYSLFGADPNYGFFFGPGQMTSNKVSESEFVPRFTLDWEFADKQMMYAYAAKGFKPGGVATVDANGDVSNGEYKPEEIWAYEAGYKSMWRDNTLRFNAAAFYYDYTDQQVPYFFVNPFTGLLNTTVINAGETEVKGFEFDLQWNSVYIEGMSGNLSYVYSDSKYSKFNIAEILDEADGAPDRNTLALAGNADADFSGHRVINAPEHSAVASGRYEFGWGDSGVTSYAELVFNYQSKRYIDLGNRAWVPDRWLADLFFGISKNRWEGTLYVTNLFDDDNIESAYANVDYGFLPDAQSVSSATALILPQPRTIGARLAYRF